ncbi:hypothetical protein JHK82_019394 [Glycine max]|nr:hypothetical protein JHK82_019394 [Glycine max]
MDGTFELNVQEHRLQEYLQSNYSLPSDNESSDGATMEGFRSVVVEDFKSRRDSQAPQWRIEVREGFPQEVP